MTPQQFFSIPNVEQEIQSAIWFTEGSDLTSDSLFIEALKRNIETQLNLWVKYIKRRKCRLPYLPATRTISNFCWIAYTIGL